MNCWSGEPDLITVRFEGTAPDRLRHSTLEHLQVQVATVTSSASGSRGEAVGEMREAVDRARLPVQNMLTERGPVDVDNAGSFTFMSGSTRVFIDVEEFGDDGAIVDGWASVITDFTPTPAFFEHVMRAGSDYRFGHFEYFEREDSPLLIFGHRILADFLDPDELQVAVTAVAFTADEVDDEFQGRFGGKREVMATNWSRTPTSSSSSPVTATTREAAPATCSATSRNSCSSPSP